MILAYMFKRVLLSVPVLLGLVTILFLVSRLLPGDPAVLFAGLDMGPAQVEKIREGMGLNDPLLTQYVGYVSAFVRGDWGRSWFTGRPVLSELLERFPATIELTLFGLSVAVVLGVTFGLVAGRAPDRTADWFVRALTLISFAVPAFWIGLVALKFFYLDWGLVPPTGRLSVLTSPPERVTGLYTVDFLLARDFEGFREAFSHLVLPGVVVGFTSMGVIARQTRASLMDALDADYIRAARTLGLGTLRIEGHLALKNALLPVITIIGLVFGVLLSGTVVIEEIFAWPGIGRYGIQALLNNDYSGVQAFVVFAAIIYLVVFLVVDVLYAVIDPRVQLK